MGATERLLDIFERDHPERRVVRLRPAFTFQRASATSKRRLFVGPFVPRALMRPGRMPVLPLPGGLRLQAVHTNDVADAYRRAVLSDASGALNVATDDVLDGPALAQILGGRSIALPRSMVRAVVATAWHGHLTPPTPTWSTWRSGSRWWTAGAPDPSSDGRRATRGGMR